jgi:hypothetical protein
MVGLARVTPSPHASFILFGGDAAHHPGMLRPSTHTPLPPHLHDARPPALHGCAPDAPALGLPGADGVHADLPAAARTLAALQVLDAREEVWVLLSHDGSVDAPGVVRWFPEALDGWRDAGWKESTRWLFLESGNAANRWEGL